MTPFGRKMREIRAERGMALKEMAAGAGVSPAYLSALEHGHRGRPSRRFVTELCLFLGIIWDEADALQNLAAISDPRVTVDTAGLTPEATLLANELAVKIRDLPPKRIAELRALLRGEPADPA